MQYFIYVWRLLQGDLGPSMVYNDFTVSEMLAIGLPFTLMLGFSAFIVATAVGLVAGALAAVNQNKWPDYVLVVLVDGRPRGPELPDGGAPAARLRRLSRLAPGRRLRHTARSSTWSCRSPCWRCRMPGASRG